MQAALATIWICVALGAALGLAHRLGVKATDPIRSFALVSAGLVAIVVLLPHAVESEGVWGLVVGAAAFAAIPLLERLGSLLFRGLPTRTVRLEVGFAGLVLHRFADGVAMRVEGHGADVLFALGAHEIPIVALVTLAYLERGFGTALLRVALLGAASTLGCVVVDVLPGALESLHGHADALAAGILWHIVVHELSEPAPAASAPRGLDVIGAALAGLILWVPSSGEDAHGALGPALLDWILVSAPAALLGLMASAMIGALWTAPAGELRRASVPNDASPETIALSWALLGWPFAAVRFAGACAAALAISFAERLRAPRAGADRRAQPEKSPREIVRRWWLGAREGSASLVVWLLLGAIVAAYVETFVERGALTLASSWRAVLAVAGTSVVARLSPIAATPIAAALIEKGLPPNAALAALWLGLSTSARTIRSLGEGKGRAAVGLLALVLLGVAAALELPVASNAIARSAPPHAWVALAFLVAICAAAMIGTGVRGWLSKGLGMRGAEGARHAHGAFELQTASSVERARAADAGRL